MKAALDALRNPFGWLGALLLLAAFAVGAALDGPEDHSADWQDSAALQALQDAEQGSKRQQAAAQALCLEARGPNSEARFTVEGHLVCTTRRGMRPVAVAQGGQP